MCLIIEQFAGDRLSEAEIADIYRRNSDGFGVMWCDPKTGKARTSVTVPADLDAAIAAYAPFAGRHCVLHWRMATSGPVDDAHCHPFTVKGGVDPVYVMHNGVIAGLGSPSESDTAEFNRSVLRPLLRRGPSALKARAVRQTIERSIVGSVLVFASSSGYDWLGRGPIKYAGRLYSNTYAWSAPAELTRPSYYAGRYAGSYAGSSSSCDVWEDEPLPSGRAGLMNWLRDRDADDDEDAEKANPDGEGQYRSEGLIYEASTTADLAEYLYDVVERLDPGSAFDLLSVDDEAELELAIDQAVQVMQDARCAPGYAIRVSGLSLFVERFWGFSPVNP